MQLDFMRTINGTQCYVHFDVAYSRQSFVDVPFRKSNPSSETAAAHISSTAVQLTVKWLYREMKLW